MNRIEHIKELNDETKARLTDVWGKSVKATHDFLSASDIDALRPFVREAFGSMDNLICVKGSDGAPSAFLGTAGNKIEMLFVHPDVRRNGLGRLLITYAIENLGAKYVDVNEQNPQASAFYERMGFKTFSRSAKDSQGNPFPILHMEKTA